MSIYDFTVLDANHNPVSLSKYQGKVLLIVNTATHCGYTPQYEGLEKLYEKYHDQGLEVLDFPCNQFLGQAPGSEAEIVSFCQSNFGVKFPTFAKIRVNGKGTEPLFAYLKANAPTEKQVEPCPLRRLFRKFVCPSTRIKWNFTKFIIDRNGEIQGRHEPAVTPAELDPIIAGRL